MSVTLEDFSSLGVNSDFFKNKIKAFNLSYKIPTCKERDEIILNICKYLFSNDVVQAGAHRKNQWEDGWGENLEEYIATSDLNSLIPKYFNKHAVQRLNGDFIIPQQSDFEIGVVSLLQYAIFEKYFKSSKNVYEFGAGTGHNLLRVREINLQAHLHSMEWAKSGVELLRFVAKNIKDDKLSSSEFDNFHPNYNFKLEPDSSVYTFAALEQLGSNTDSIIDYWIENKPSIIVNIEPMSEPLNDNELLQYLSIKYFEKRRYLKDYIAKIKVLESEGLVTIHDITRTGIGSLFIEGYSLIAWSPNK